MCTAPAAEKSPSSAKYGPLRMRIDAINSGMRKLMSAAVRGHVDRHAIDRDGQIGAMVEIEAAQKVLVGFSLAAVLRDDQAGDGFQEFAGTCGGLCVDTRAHAGLLAGADFGSGLISWR